MSAAYGPAAVVADFEDQKAEHRNPASMPVVGLGLPFDQSLRRAVHWFLATRGAKIAPGWRDIDPESLGDLLPLAWVVRVEPLYPIFTYRFAGSMVANALGCDPTGMALSEVLPPQTHEIIHGRYMAAVRERAVYFAIGRVRIPAGQDMICERAVFPLIGANGMVDHLLGFSLYQVPPVSVGVPFEPARTAIPGGYEDETIASYVPLKALHFFAR